MSLEVARNKLEAGARNLTQLHLLHGLMTVRAEPVMAKPLSPFPISSWRVLLGFPVRTLEARPGIIMSAHSALYMGFVG